MSDIYAAPSAKLDHIEADRAIEYKKPKAVLLLQLWALLAIALLGIAFMKNYHNLHGRYFMGALNVDGQVRAYTMGTLIFALLGMMYCLDRRWLAGRILGIVVIFLTSLPVLIQFFIPQLRLPMPAELFRLGVLVLFLLGFLYWGYALSFSDRARGFFSQSPD